MLRSALRSRGLRIALAALLLFAQQGALTHALTHAGWQAHGVAAHGDDHGHDHDSALSAVHGGDASDKSTSSKSATSEQCAFDLVYSQVLGGVHAGCSIPPDATAQIALFFTVAPQSGAIALRLYDSRGPPDVA